MKKFKILVIDIQSDSGTFLEEILGANGFAVKRASNGEGALELLNEELADLIFIEAGLPGMVSFATCKTIKANDKWSGIPVIFMIGFDDLALVKEIYESGGDDYILKPLIWSDLLTRVRTHLELKYSRRMAKNMNQMLEDKVVQRTNELEDSLKMLRQANKDLEILEIAKSDFFNLISHEIRTPLNGIMGSLALIDRYTLPDGVNRYFSLLDLSVKRLEKFSNIILEASILRIKGEKALARIQTDLVPIVRDALDRCIVQFQDKNIVVDFQDNSSNSHLKGDQKYLLKCFTAVFENAFKFSPSDEKLEIEIINEPGGKLKIIVTDSGKGFSKAALDNIFNSLSNLEAHFDQNTGMGLHLAKLIIDAHSGFITVGNRSPKGAFVEIVIPSGY